MDLESMIGSDNASSLYNDTSIYKDSATMYKFYGYMRLVLSFVSFLSDVLIVTVMAKNRSANTRTNKLLMHFGIMDAFCMLNEMGVFYMVLDTVMTHLKLNRLFCVFVIFEVTSLCASFLFIFLLLSNTLMKSTRFSDRTLLSVYYAIIGGILTSEILLCAIRPSSFSIFHSINFVLFAIAAVCLLIKEVNRMYKYFKNRPLSQSTAFRMNVARIYVYSCWTNFFFYGPNKFFLVISLSGYLAGFYILLYLAYSDRNFKSCLMDFLKFRMHNQNADGTVRFADDCSEDGRPDYNVTYDATATTSILARHEQ